MGIISQLAPDEGWGGGAYGSAHMVRLQHEVLELISHLLAHKKFAASFVTYSSGGAAAAAAAAGGSGGGGGAEGISALLGLVLRAPWSHRAGAASITGGGGGGGGSGAPSLHAPVSWKPRQLAFLGAALAWCFSGLASLTSVMELARPATHYCTSTK